MIGFEIRLQSRLITCIWIWISGERRRMEERSMHQVFESRYSRKVYYISRYRTVPSFFFWKSNERNRLIRKFNFPRKPQKLSKRDFLLINFIKTIRHLWTFQRSKKNFAGNISKRRRKKIYSTLVKRCNVGRAIDVNLTYLSGVYKSGASISNGMARNASTSRPLEIMSLHDRIYIHSWFLEWRSWRLKVNNESWQVGESLFRRIVVIQKVKAIRIN